GRDEAAFGGDFFIDALRILLADECDAVVLVDDDAVFDDLVLFAVEADNVAALNQCSHCRSFLITNEGQAVPARAIYLWLDGGFKPWDWSDSGGKVATGRRAPSRWSNGALGALALTACPSVFAPRDFIRRLPRAPT